MMISEPILYRQQDDKRGGSTIPYLIAKPDGTFEKPDIKKINATGS